MGVLDEFVVGVREDLAERQARRSLDELAADAARLGASRVLTAKVASDALTVPVVDAVAQSYPGRAGHAGGR